MHLASFSAGDAYEKTIDYCAGVDVHYRHSSRAGRRCSTSGFGAFEIVDSARCRACFGGRGRRYDRSGCQDFLQTKVAAQPAGASCLGLALRDLAKLSGPTVEKNAPEGVEIGGQVFEVHQGIALRPRIAVRGIECLGISDVIQP